jgi:hypothetical protein
MSALLFIWVAVGAVLLALGMHDRRHSAGLPLAYFLGLSLIHTPGAMLYLDSEAWSSLAISTRVGFEQTVIGMMAFAVAVIAARWVAFASEAQQKSFADATIDLTMLDRLAIFYICGGISYFALMMFGKIPTIGAIISSLSSLLLVGASLRLWVAYQSKNRFKFWTTIALLPGLPLLTVIKDGFLGFGTYWLLAITCFGVNQSKQRVGYYLLAPLVGFVGLSLFVNYLAAREDLRQLVWRQQAEVGDRFNRVVRVFEEFEWLDLSNSKHRNLIDLRLNQNELVGLAAARLDSGAVDYANGATIRDMLIGLIPRALWPEKPAVGGGGNVVEHFTGVQFAAGTSVGAGQVLEFYVNFGTWGVIMGFMLYGWMLGTMDVKIISCLWRGDQRGFLMRFMMCLALLQPGGNLLEIVVSVASSAVAGFAIGSWADRYVASQQKQQKQQKWDGRPRLS